MQFARSSGSAYPPQMRTSRLLLVAAIALVAAPAGHPSDPVRSTADGTLPEVLLSRQLLETAGVEVGDVVSFSVHRTGAEARRFRVAGSYEPVPDPFRFTARRHEARFHLPDLIDLKDPGSDPIFRETVTRINVALEDPADYDAFSRDLSSKVPGLAVFPARRTPDEAVAFLVLERFHTAIAAVTVVGSSAFLLALMIIRSDERRETAGILRLIGLTRPRILFEGFIEGLCIATLGAVIGVLIAVALEGPFNRFFQWRYDTPLVFLRVTSAIAAKCVAIAMPLGILAGLVAAWALLRRNIMALLRR